MNKDEMLALAERVEKASGPDRGLDLAIVFHLYGPDRDMKGMAQRGSFNPTASLDVAMTLQLPGWRWWKAGDSATGGSRMVVVDTAEEGRWTVFGECPCPDTLERNALALCAAALRARAATLP